MASPGSRARFKGSEIVEVDTEEFSNPLDNESDADEDVIVSWRSLGFVEDVYCPGRRCSEVGAPGAVIVAPTICKVSL